METITVTVRRTARDRFGDRVSSEDHSSDGWVFAPGAVLESDRDNESHGDQVTSRMTGYGPPNVDIESADEIVFADGTRWQLAGPPLNYVDPFPGNSLSGTVIKLERVMG